MVMLFHMQTSRYTTSTHKQTNTHYDTPIHTHTHWETAFIMSFKLFLSQYYFHQSTSKVIRRNKSWVGRGQFKSKLLRSLLKICLHVAQVLM